MPIQMEEPEPEFLQALENHTVTQGRDVHFTCVVNHLSNYRVSEYKFIPNFLCWIRNLTCLITEGLARQRATFWRATYGVRYSHREKQ